MKNVKVEWCENFIRATFKKLQRSGADAIEMNLFWDMAEAAGLWVRGSYGSPMSKALENLATVEFIHDDKGNYLYTVFKMA